MSMNFRDAMTFVFVALMLGLAAAWPMGWYHGYQHGVTEGFRRGKEAAIQEIRRRADEAPRCMDVIAPDPEKVDGKKVFRVTRWLTEDQMFAEYGRRP
jgi:hypothetical protein